MRASFRFYAELNDHLPSDQQYGTVKREFIVPTSIKDMIEASLPMYGDFRDTLFRLAILLQVRVPGSPSLRQRQRLYRLYMARPVV